MINQRKTDLIEQVVSIGGGGGLGSTEGAHQTSRCGLGGSGACPQGKLFLTYGYAFNLADSLITFKA